MNIFVQGMIFSCCLIYILCMNDTVKTHNSYTKQSAWSGRRRGIKRGLTSSDIKINGELLGRGAHIYGQSKEGE